ncbi:lipopolysaccharide heptosyltransferase II [candidate division KSB1 bacterium]|nr:lipopolysaccharide heptosyltransferase II [candidate division KSB1 bacterium]
MKIANEQSILLIHTAFIGDLILTTPLIREAKKKFPDGRLSLLVTPQTAPLFSKNADIDEIIVYDKRGKQRGVAGFLRLLSRIRRQRFDQVLLPHRSLRSSLLSFFSGASIRIGFDRAAGSWLLTHKLPYREDRHEVDRNLSLLNAVGVYIDGVEPEIVTDQQDRDAVLELLSKAEIDINAEIIGVAPGSVWPTKRWPAHYFKALIHMLQERGLQVILLGGKADEELAVALTPPLHRSILNLVGKLSLTESAEILKLCRVLVTNDSAPMHLAAAVGTPTVSIFGPTVTRFGFAPRGNRHRIVEIDLPCRPCGKHGGIQCPLKTHACMTHIYPRRVLDQTLELLRSKSQ